MRTKRVTKSDFAAVSARFHFDPGMIKAWNEHIPLMPETAIEILMRDLSADTYIDALLDADGNGEFSFLGNDYNVMTATYDVVAGTHALSQTEIAEGAFKKKVGRKTVRNQLEFMHACGAHLSNVYASKEAGGYVWASLYLFDDDPYSDYASRERALECFNLLNSNGLDQAIYEQGCAAVRKSSPDFIWDIADMEQDVAPCLRRIFHDATIKGHVKAGFLALAGTRWNGHLNMDDPIEMQHADRKIGWKYIQVPK